MRRKLINVFCVLSLLAVLYTIVIGIISIAIGTMTTFICISLIVMMGLMIGSGAWLVIYVLINDEKDDGGI